MQKTARVCQKNEYRFLDAVAKEWGCPNVDDSAFYGNTEGKTNFHGCFVGALVSGVKKSGHLIMHFVRTACGPQLIGNEEALCARRTRNGSRWYLDVHLVGECPYSTYLEIKPGDQVMPRGSTLRPGPPSHPSLVWAKERLNYDRQD